MICKQLTRPNFGNVMNFWKGACIPSNRKQLSEKAKMKLSSR